MKFRIGDRVNIVFTDKEGVIEDIYFNLSMDYVYKVIFSEFIPLFLTEDMLEVAMNPAEYMS